MVIQIWKGKRYQAEWRWTEGRMKGKKERSVWCRDQGRWGGRSMARWEQWKRGFEIQKINSEKKHRREVRWVKSCERKLVSSFLTQNKGFVDKVSDFSGPAWWTERLTPTCFYSRGPFLSVRFTFSYALMPTFFENVGKYVNSPRSFPYFRVWELGDLKIIQKCQDQKNFSAFIQEHVSRGTQEVWINGWRFSRTSCFPWPSRHSPHWTIWHLGGTRV